MPGEEPLLVHSDKGPTVLYKGVALYPPENPLGSARAKACAAQLAPRSLVYVPSVGLGHGMAELLARLPESSAVLCVETDPRILALAAAQGLPRDERLIVLGTSDAEQIARVVRSLGLSRFRRVVEIPLSAGYRLDPRTYGRVRALLEGLVRAYWQDAMTLIAMGSLWVRNLIENLAVLPGSRDFSCLATTAPVVVAGAGPSLEAGLPVLREARDGFVLVAADTALPRLMAESLRPDIVVALEGQVANIQDFLTVRDPGIRLACELTAHPSTARLFPENRFFFSSRFAPLALFRRLEQAGILPCPFPALGSVGVAAAHAALRLTTGEVFLIGLDFSFPGSRTHARGTPRHIAALLAASRTHGIAQDSVRALVSRPAIRERGKDGARIATDSVLRSYRDGLRVEAAGEAGRVWDLGRTGLDLGIGRIGEDDFARRVHDASGVHDAGRVQAREGPVFSLLALESFLRAEAARPGCRKDHGADRPSGPGRRDRGARGRCRTARRHRLRVRPLPGSADPARAIEELPRAGAGRGVVLQAADRGPGARNQSSDVLSTARKAD
jgi:hypothetical protein